MQNVRGGDVAGRDSCDARPVEGYFLCVHGAIFLPEKGQISREIEGKNRPLPIRWNNPPMGLAWCAECAGGRRR